MRVNSSSAVVFAVCVVALLLFALIALAPGVEAKRVAAQKFSIQAPKLGGGFGTSAPKLVQRHPVSDCPDELPRVIENRHILCDSQNTPRVVSDVDVRRGGIIEIRGGSSLRFTGQYALSVWDGGSFLIYDGSVLSLVDQGYQIISYHDAVIEFHGANVTGAAGVYVSSRDAKFYDLKYHDNGRGLVLAGEGAVVDEENSQRSQFYDNANAGLEIQGTANAVRNSDFYAGSGTQRVGILVSSARKNLVDGNVVHGNDVGISLTGSGENTVSNNNVYGNTVAGVRNFVEHPIELRDNQLMPLPNTLNGNSITGNGDGVIDYTVGMNIEEPQAILISGNSRYGLVSIDTDAHQDVEASVGSNGLGKAANLRSMRVGGIIYGGAMPDHTVYVTYCEEDIDNCVDYTGDRNDARNYGDYTQPYSTTRGSPPRYFTSNLVASEEKTFRGSHGMWTPRFLAYYYRLQSATRNYACDENVNGFNCVARAVTFFDGQDHGQSNLGVQPSPQYEYVFLEMEGAGFKNTKPKTVTLPSLENKRRAATKMIPELRAVKTPPKYSDSN